MNRGRGLLYDKERGDVFQRDMHGREKCGEEECGEEECGEVLGLQQATSEFLQQKEAHNPSRCEGH